jgi:hypothetical protein
MRSTITRKYWFPAKRFGWGWGLPTAWQGWVVLAAYFALVIGAIPLIHAAERTAVYIAYVVLVTVALVLVCWVTGEPPRWREPDA